MLPQPLVRNNCKIRWISRGEGEDQPKLRFESYLLDGDNWLPIQGGSILTQVRENEEFQILFVLLEKLADRIEPLCADYRVENNKAILNNGNDVLEKLEWFGPEFAEEY